MNLSEFMRINYTPKFIHIPGATGDHPILTICYFAKIIKSKNKDMALVSYGISIRNMIDRYDRKKGNSRAADRAKTIGMDNAFIVDLDDFTSNQELKKSAISKIITEFYDLSQRAISGDDADFVYFKRKYLLEDYNGKNEILKALLYVACNDINVSK